MSKILCPFHEETTPSCDVKDTGYVCYGCGKKGPLRELEAVGVTPPKRNIMRKAFQKKEDMTTSLARIAKLPKKPIRGLELPYDDSGYYILYPNVSYYTKRLWNPPKPADKYRGPLGHRKPLLQALSTSGGVLFIVEGQLNALSLAASVDCAVVSPGSATDLNREDFVKYYLQYEHICVIVDKDPAGVVAGITLRDTLLTHRKDVALYPLAKDLNEIFNEENGPQKVQTEARKALGLLLRL